MNGFMAFMEKYFIPVAAKIGSQKHLVAIRDGFVAIMPLIIAGAFAVLINNLDFGQGSEGGYQAMMRSIFGGDDWKNLGGDIWAGSFGVLSLLAVFAVGYNVGKAYDSDGLATGIVCFGALIILYSTDANGAYPGAFLGSAGLFISLIVALLGGTIFVKLLGNPKLVIKMPEGVPPAVAKSFAALFPAIIVLVLAAAVKEALKLIDVVDIHASLQWTLQGPLDVLGGSLVALLIVILLTQLLWFFGLHGSNILLPVMNTVFLPLTLANAEAYNAGKSAMEVPNVINSAFLDAFVNLGGSGATICLIIAIMICAKNKAQKAIANLAFAPGLFNINEPIQFGLPIVLNPIFIVPFILVPIVCALIAYFATTLGLIPKVVVVTPWTTPPVLGAFLATGGNFLAGAVALINMVIGTLIYIPFVIMNDKKMAQDAAQALED